MFIYGNWEYHPVYGTCSRLVYKRIGKNSLAVFGRQYKSLKG